MSFSIGIIGLPNVGKSTLFKALTKQKVDISNYPFCTIDPNVGIVKVPDKRLEKIAEVIKPQKITPTVIEFVDIAGLVKNAHKGEGLGNQFLARIREVDAICQIVRAFKDEKISHIEGQVNPERDIEIINTELIMKDLETIEKRLEKTKKEANSENKEAILELEAINKAKEILKQGKMLSESGVSNIKHGTRELYLLTIKPMVYVFNGSEDPSTSPALLQKGGVRSGNKLHGELVEPLLPERVPTLCRDESKALHLNLQLESELSELTPEEAKELELPPSKLNELIKICYQALNLITFYTVAGGKETRAWTLKNGLKAPKAGGVVHTDFEENFIRAEVIIWQKLIEASSWSKAREKGWLRIEGREYIVQDGDVIEFKI